jgi:hypothetical protein
LDSDLDLVSYAMTETGIVAKSHRFWPSAHRQTVTITGMTSMSVHSPVLRQFDPDAPVMLSHEGHESVDT